MTPPLCHLCGPHTGNVAVTCAACTAAREERLIEYEMRSCEREAANERLREALAFYAEPTNYTETVENAHTPFECTLESDVATDSGKRARAALNMPEVG